eukprot:5190938-Prymnesium_polylepis.1
MLPMIGSEPKAARRTATRACWERLMMSCAPSRGPMTCKLRASGTAVTVSTRFATVHRWPGDVSHSAASATCIEDQHAKEMANQRACGSPTRHTRLDARADSSAAEMLTLKLQHMGAADGGGAAALDPPGVVY